jgi:glycosyltransferase involved in cell wall biosynthesis
VIVPVHNDAARVGRCLEGLRAQTYPADRYEVLVVDNRSTDGTTAVVRAYPVTLLREDRVQGSYAARNRGLEAARGEILAFTDSDCVPAPDWLAAGVAALGRTGADLAGGAVRFECSAKPTGAEIFDATHNMQIERNVRDGVAKTANLFVRARVFAEIGRFPDGVRSGGDVTWTRRATRSGLALVYAPDAVVMHPARRLRELLRKQYRVGRGQPAIWADAGAPLRRVLADLFGAVAPPGRLRYVRRAMERRAIPVSRGQMARAWAAGWLCRLTRAAGNVHALGDWWRAGRPRAPAAAGARARVATRRGSARRRGAP